MPSESSDTLAQPYAGRVISLKKLPGWADKWLEVPVCWHGVVVDANGSRIPL
jgi:hypothetical protein